MKSKEIQEKIEFLVRKWLREASLESVISAEESVFSLESVPYTEDQLCLVFLGGLDDYVVEDLWKEAQSSAPEGD
jgi:hypothetical protein